MQNNKIKVGLYGVMFLQSFTLFPEYFVAISAVYILIVAVLITRNVYGLVIQKALSGSIALIMLLTCYLIINEDLVGSQSLSFNNGIINDYLAVFTKFVVCFSSAIYFFIIADSLKEQKLVSFEYLLILLFAVLGLMLLCSSNDLLTAYLSIELTSLSLYILACFKKTSSYSVDAGIKYFVTGSISSAIFLLGSSMIYASSGSICILDLTYLISFEKFAPIFDPLLAWRNVEYKLEALRRIEPFLFLDKDCIINRYHLIQLRSDLYNVIADLVATEKMLDRLHVKSDPVVALGNMQRVLEILRFTQPFALLDKDCLTVYHNYKTQCTYDFYCAIAEAIAADKMSDNLRWSYLSDCNYSFVELGLFLILFSLYIKLALAPFHLWSLDVYEGSPISSTFFFAVICKLSIFVFLLRLCYVGFIRLNESWQFYSLWVGIFSVFVGSFGGLKQRRLKTLLAYSSTGHIGYALLAFSTGSNFGVQMVLFYLIIYIISGLSVWLILLGLRLRKINYVNKYSKELGDLVLLRKSNPALALAFSLTMFSIAGIPPLVGFFTKMGVFLSVIMAEFYAIALLTILCSVVSAFYYIRVIKVLYFENVLVGKLYYPITSNKTTILGFLIFLQVFLFINPTLLYLIIYDVVFESF